MSQLRNLPPLTALRAFAAFAEVGTMTGAGAAINVSHAAISQQIRALEAHLGLTLLDRSGRRPVPTAAGARLAEAVAAGFGEILRVTEELTGADASRPVHVTTTPTFASFWLMPRLADFRATYPAADLTLDATPDLRPLSPGGVDLAVRYGSGEWPGLDAELLLPTPIVLVASPALVGDAAGMSVADLAPFHWLQELGTGEATEFLTRFGIARDAGKGITSLPGNLMLDAARDGQGVAVTARAFVEPDIIAGRLRLLHVDDRPKGYFLVKRRDPLRPPAQDFVRWLRRMMRGASSRTTLAATGVNAEGA